MVLLLVVCLAYGAIAGSHADVGSDRVGTPAHQLHRLHEAVREARPEQPLSRVAGWLREGLAEARLTQGRLDRLEERNVPKLSQEWFSALELTEEAWTANQAASQSGMSRWDQKFTRKAYFFLLMYYPRHMRIWETHKKVYIKNEPPPSKPPGYTSLLQLGELSDPGPAHAQPQQPHHHTHLLSMDRHGAPAAATARGDPGPAAGPPPPPPPPDWASGGTADERLAHRQLPHLQDVHDSLLGLLEVSEEALTATTGFYDWLARVLVWIYRWFRWYVLIEDSNMLKVRYWNAELHDNSTFVMRFMYPPDVRWAHFLECRGPWPCRAPPDPNELPKDDVAGEVDASYDQGRSFGGFGGSFEEVDLSDEIEDEWPPGFGNFSNCTRYVECKEEMYYDVAFRNFNGTYPDARVEEAVAAAAAAAAAGAAAQRSSSKATNLAAAQGAAAAPLKADQRRSQQGGALAPEQNNRRTAPASKAAPGRDLEADPENERAWTDSGLQLEKSLIHMVEEGSDRLGPVEGGFDRPSGEMLDAENDGQGEAAHLLRGMPPDLWNGLPGMMRAEENIFDAQRAKPDQFDDLWAVTESNEADEHNQKLR